MCTSKFLLFKLLALQEQLAGWLMDYYIVKLGVECSIILVQCIGRIVFTLHQSGFTLAASLFLGGRNLAAKEYNISLAVTTNIQKNIFSWLFLLAAKKNMYFLGCLAESPRKWSLSLAVLVGRQEKYVFPWLHC